MAKKKAPILNAALEEQANAAIDQLEGQALPRPQMVDGSSRNEDVEAYRQQISADIFHAIVHGLRIQVAPTEYPLDVACRICELHSAIMDKAREAGIIPAAEEVD